MRYDLIETCLTTGAIAVVCINLTHGDAVLGALNYQAQSGWCGVRYTIRPVHEGYQQA
jgi:hypothetical protein